MELTHKVVLVTGAKGGLGNTVTKSLLDAGARVVGVAREITSGDFPHERFCAKQASLSDPSEARRVVAEVGEEMGGLDALVHLVGAYAGGASIEETDESALDRMIDINLRTAFYAVKAVLPLMHRQGAGRIVAIGSKSAVEPSAMSGVYAASKAALISLIRTAAQENAAKGISCNVILPGTMDTPANRAALPDVDPALWVDPNQVARLIVHLLSDAASNINGAVIPVVGREV